ncbi:MAG TPA: ferritin-like domain-containing protein [Rhodanobacteraceae bacterium]
MATKQPFLTDIQTIRQRARKHMHRGAITPSYTLDRDTVLKLLNEALATEIVCVLRYKAHYYLASGINAKSVAAEFQEHADEEQQHADMIAERITQLDGKPNFEPDGLSGRSHAEFVVPEDLPSMIEENLVAERIAIDSYREIINFVGDQDTTTKRLLESILAQEEEHAEDMKTLMEDFGKKGEPADPQRGAKPGKRH